MKRTLGDCYYPEHWPEAQWAEDAARMARLGLTWVRIGEFAWSRMEPEPGRYDWGEVYSPVVNEWFSDVIGEPCQLVYMGDDSRRDINERFNKGGEVVSFADGYPLLVIGEASLEDLNQKLRTNANGSGAFHPLAMNRFRPNIVV